VLGVKKFFLKFLVDILLLGSGSANPHIFADPDSGSQNLADPTDPDPKHWYQACKQHGYTKSGFQLIASLSLLVNL